MTGGPPAAPSRAERAAGARFVPGQPDMWAFVLFEAFVFTAYFAVYVFSRARGPEAFLASQAHLDPRVGVLNTLVLLTSSWSVARCVLAARRGAWGAARTHAFVTLVFGLVFVVSKISEWSSGIAAGFTFTTDEFSSFYYFLTGIHFLHLLIGFGALAIAIRQIQRPALRSQEIIETCATYWHTIDFLWVLIFALLYVVR